MPRTKIIIFLSILVILGSLGAFLYMQSGGGEESPTPQGLGVLGAKCGGPEHFPCQPGTMCSIPAEQYETTYGTCIEDTRPAPELAGENEPCNNVEKLCGPGLKCSIPEGGTEGTCGSIVHEDAPIILALAPEGMELIQGVYRAPVGAKIKIRVRAFLVTGGAVYLKPLTSSIAGASEDMKISELTKTKYPGEYEGEFTMTEASDGELMAIMKGEDGADLSLSIIIGVKQ